MASVIFPNYQTVYISYSRLISLYIILSIWFISCAPLQIKYSILIRCSFPRYSVLSRTEMKYLSSLFFLPLVNQTEKFINRCNQTNHFSTPGEGQTKEMEVVYTLIEEEIRTKKAIAPRKRDGNLLRWTFPMRDANESCNDICGESVNERKGGDD